MKEKDFMKKFGITINVPIYYAIDRYKNVSIDEESMQEAFEEKLNKVLKGVKKW
jgi:hypothetical protein